jgi:iron complex outermembrane receptor protein
MNVSRGKGLKFGLSVGALALGLAMAPVSYAQDAADDNGNGGIAEITVTAQRYEQKLQDTPLSVVAIDAEQLTSQGSDSLGSFDAFIPNVSIGGTAAQGSAIANFAIRGIGGAPSGFVTQESAVGIYVDDILFARPNGALLDLLDVERVEVLRGPQGTLFGRNTAGGAIRYVSKQPSDKLEGSIKGLAGSRDRYEISGVLNLPLSDTLATRLSFSKKSRDGYIHRVIDDTNVGGGESTTLRGQLRWQPTDRLDINLSGDLIRTSDNGQPTVSYGFSPNDLYTAALYNVAVAGDPPISAAAYNSMRALAPASVSPSGYTNAASDFAFYTNKTSGRYEVYGGLLPDTNRYKSYGLSGTLAYELTDSITLKSLTGYRDLSQVQNQDWDRTPIPLVQLNERIDIEYFTQEFQLSGSSLNDRLKWVAGLFYYWDKADDIRRRFDPSAGANSALAGDVGLGTLENKFIETKSYAAFAQGSFSLTDALSFTAGLRWSKDQKDYSSLRDGRGQECVAGGAVVAAVGTPASCPVGSVSTSRLQAVSGSWSNVSPRLGIDYRWSPEIMTYVSAAKGYKGGGFNDTVQTRCYRSPFPNCGLSEFQEENLWTYEVGLRTDLFDRRIRFNVTGFLTKYKDQQIQLIDVGPPPLQYTINGDSTVKGVEVEFLAAPTDGLILRANLGYVDSKYDENLNGLSGKVALTPDVPFFRSPKWSYSLGATYEVPVSQSGKVAMDVNWGWKGSQASYPNPTNMVILPSYGLLNGRLTYKADAGWSIAVFGNNLTNEYYLSGGFDPSGPTTKATPGLTGTPHDRVFGFTMIDIGRPREFGVEVSYKF